MKINKKYLPLKKFHIVGISSLEPEAIKLAAKRTKKDHEKVAYTTILNAIAHSLAINGGFSGYESYYNSEIKPFMEEHKLRNQANLFTPRKPGFALLINDIRPQDLSERIFFSGLEIPKRVFTGHNFDYENSISDGIYTLNSLSDSFGIMRDDSKKAISNNIKLAQNDPNKLIPINDKETRRLIDVVIGGFLFHYSYTFNLIGDSLFQPENIEPVVKLYNENNYCDELVKDKEQEKLIYSIFRERIEESEMGWVDIIPFNKNLVFLRGLNGEYDFLFRNQRDEQFEHKVFGGALKISDIPDYIDDYHFLRWEYFEHQGWREKESHEAENLFYKQDGKIASYPEFDAVRKAYYKFSGVYTTKKQVKSNQLRDGFVHTFVNNKHLAISNLISIKEFELFTKENIDYLNNRIGESLVSNNKEENISLPITLTFYDALVYSKWYQEKTGLHVRLLTYLEYLALRKNCQDFVKINESLNMSDLIYLNDKGNPYKSHPPYMGTKQFDDLICKFNPSIKMKVLDNGLAFYPSNHFAEWLMEKTCIRSGNLKSFYNDKYVLRAKPPAEGTGKYKHLKIGFRLCYDLDS
jgi:hypothetical protein